MTETPPGRPSEPRTGPAAPAPAHGDGPTGPSAPTGRTEPATDAPDECTGCGRDDGPMYLDPRPRHPRDPQAQYCQDCAADLFDIGDEEPDHA